MTTVPYLWIPGEGADFDAALRLRHRNRRPSTPMGEAWFMGETRRMFDLSGDVYDIPNEELEHALLEIAGGFACFGWMREWDDWFHYLLAELADGGHFHAGYHSSLVESLVSAFVVNHPDGVTTEPRRGFRRDVLATLGRSLMHRDSWDDGHIVRGTILHRYSEPGSGRGDWYAPAGDLSASLCFCLKYLTPDEIGPWLGSVVAIACPCWRAQLLAFVVAVHPLLSGECEHVRELEKHFPALTWEGSVWMRGNYTGSFAEGQTFQPFLAPGNRAAALEALQDLFSQDMLLEWLVSIDTIPGLESELLDLPDRVQSLYMTRH